MVKKKEAVDRLLMIVLNVLLAGLISIILFGGRIVTSSFKEIIANQKETVQAVNELRITLAIHSRRINDGEQKDIWQDANIKQNEFKIKENIKRIHVLEDITK